MHVHIYAQIYTPKASMCICIFVTMQTVIKSSPHRNPPCRLCTSVNLDYS